MAQLFTNAEEILEVLLRQEEGSEDEFDNLESSDEEDNILENDDDIDDVFDADDEHPYKEFDALPGQRNFVLGKDGLHTWTDQPLGTQISKTKGHNISHLPGPKSRAKGIKDPLQLFSLFISDAMLLKVVQYTNLEIERVMENFQSNQYYISKTSLCELKALIGLLIRAGTVRQADLNTEDLFSPVDGIPFFKCTMAKNRFEFLLRTLRFDDKRSRNERKLNDKFAAFRDIWTSFTENCKSSYTPCEYLTVDETLLGFRGRCPFRMYTPSKPEKYGLKVISLCDAKTFYFIDGIPYVGKNSLPDTNKKFSIPTRYVLELTKTIEGTNRNITTDNWFTSIELAVELKKRKLTLIGTLRKNKPQIPAFMIDTKKIPEKTSRFLYDPDMVLVSYVPKKNKNVLLISTMHDSGDIDQTTRKPEINLLYNETKIGVDVLDQMCHNQTCSRKTRRWPLRFFYGMVDIGGVNAYVLHQLNEQATYSKRKRRIFLKQLSYSLVEPWMKERLKNKHISRDLRSTIEKIVGAPDREETPRPPSKKPRRCDVCADEKLHRDRKGYAFCNHCNACLCGEHKKTIVICPNCETAD